MRDTIIANPSPERSARGEASGTSIRFRPISRLRLFGLLVLLLAAWLAAPPVERPLAAAPLAQAEPSPSPRPGAAGVARPTAEEQLNELQNRKLNREIRLIDVQIERLRQQLDIDGQAWRAPADAVAAFGPTLVGLGLLYLLARALSHWLPARPVGADESLDDFDEELDAPPSK